MAKISLDMPEELLHDLRIHVGDEKKFVSLADAIRSACRKMLDQLDSIDMEGWGGFNLSNRREAEEAVRIILNYIEGDHQREGLLDTPKRVIDSFSEIYAGYQEDIESILSSQF